MTLKIYEKLGIKCDVTLRFAAHEGLRAGDLPPVASIQSAGRQAF